MGHPDRHGAGRFLGRHAGVHRVRPAGRARRPAAGPDGSLEYTFRTSRWDPVRKASLREWEVTGNRTDAVRHYAPYAVSLGVEQGDYSHKEKKLQPAKVRCYSLADGRLAHEWTTGFAGLDADRVQGGFLLTTGYESKWITRGRTLTFTPQPPFAYDVWEIPTGQGVRVFELDRQATAGLGPRGQYVLRVRDDGAVEVHEPFVLKKAVATVTAPARPEQFEFAPDGGRVAVSLADTSVAVWDTAPWQTAIDAAVARAVPADLGPLWDDLAADAPAGLRAARLLAAAGDRGIALLKAKVTSRQAPAADRVARLIADLDAPRFAAREKAEADLRRPGPAGRAVPPAGPEGEPLGRGGEAAGGTPGRPRRPQVVPRRGARAASGPGPGVAGHSVRPRATGRLGQGRPGRGPDRRGQAGRAVGGASLASGGRAGPVARRPSG